MTKTIFTLLFGLLVSSTALAEKLPGQLALHIAKLHYEHPVRLLHPYLDVWHMKGPLAEKAALKTLQKRFANVGDCNSSANVVLSIEPHMFYNAQLRVFHAEIIARAYVSTTDLSTQSAITTIKKQAQQNGDIGVKPEFYMEKAYVKAMDKVIKKLDTDKAFLATLDKAKIENPKLICNALDDLPVSKIYY
jgi:hypothetical protein